MACAEVAMAKVTAATAINLIISSSQMTMHVRRSAGEGVMVGPTGASAGSGGTGTAPWINLNAGRSHALTCVKTQSQRPPAQASDVRRSA